MSEIVGSEPLRDEDGKVIGVRVVRESADGTRTEMIEPLEKPSPARPYGGPEYEHTPVESPADRIWREK